MIATSLREFVAIVEEGSVSEAARRLEMPRATLSRHLGALEDELGVTLMHRETRRLVLTQAGDALYRKARQIVAEIDEVEQAVRMLDGVPRGLLRVSVPNALTTSGTGLIGAYLELCPEVSIDIITTSRHVDLVGEGVHVALRGGKVRDPGLMVRQLLESNTLVVASPELVERVGPIENLDDLERLPSVLSYEAGWKPVNHYPLRHGGTVRISGRLRTNELALSRGIALQGRAAALLPEPFITDDLEAGRLVPILPDQLGFMGSLSLVWPQSDHLDPKVRAFIDCAVDYFEEWGLGPAAPSS